MGPLPGPGSTAELALVAGVWLSGPQGRECGRPEPTAALPWGGTSAEVMLSPAPTFPPPAARKAAHRVVSSGALPLPCSLPAATLRIRPHSSPGQHSRPDPDDEMWVQVSQPRGLGAWESWPCRSFWVGAGLMPCLPCPHHLQHLGELSLRSSQQDRQCYPSLDPALRRADPALLSSTVELTLMAGVQAIWP